MNRSLMRTLSRLLVSGAAIFALVLTVWVGIASAAAPPAPAQTPTAPGTVINNTATATYSDANNQSYSTASNTVSTTVQNAPVLAISPQATQNVAPNQLVTDTYTLYNTGNAPATFAIADPTVTGSGTTTPQVGTGGTFVGYIVNGALTGTCSTQNPCTTVSAVNAYLATLTPTGTITTAGVIPPTVGIEYRVSPGAAANSTVTTALTATSTQAAANGQPAQTSKPVSATDTDTVLAPARIDLQKTVTTPTSATAPITYTIFGNNGGSFPAVDLSSVNSLLGSTVTGGHAGVLLVDKIPTFTTGPQPTIVAGTPALTLASSLPSTTKATIVYSTSTDGLSGWSTSPTGATYIGVYLFNNTSPTTGVGGNLVLPANPTGSTGAGNANPPPSSVSSPQFTLSFGITQPTGSGSGNASALKNIANAIAGGNPNVDGTVPVIGPGIVAGTVDSSTLSLGPAISNTTSSSGTAAPGGASNTVFASAYASAVVNVGPISFPDASGQAPGTTGYTTSNDFTALGFVCTNNASATALPQSSNATSCGVPTAGVQVPNTFKNEGNNTDTFTISVKPPVGFTAAIYTTNCPIPTGGFTTVPSATLNPAPTPVCTTGTLIATTLVGGAYTGTYPGTVSYTNAGGTALTNGVASGATADFIVVYSAAAGVAPGVAADALVTVTGSQTAAFPQADTNTTHNTLYPGGALSYTKSQTILSDNCAASTTTSPTAGGSPAFPTTGPTPVCPGGVIQYSLVFADSAPAGTTAVTAQNTEPAFATKALTALSLLMSEDGAATVNGVANGWALNTFGLNGAVSQTSSAVGTPTATLAYSNGTGFSSGTYPTTKTLGYTAFTAQVSSLNPGQGATLVFTVTVK